MSALADTIRAYAAEHPDLNNQQIAEAVGCTRSMIWKALNPEIARESMRRTNAKRQDTKNAWQRQHDRSSAGRSRCPRCGGPQGIASARRRVEACASCLAEIAALRADLIVACWDEGWAMREIAELLGVTIGCLSGEMGRLRIAGRLRYRHHGSYGKYTEPVGGHA